MRGKPAMEGFAATPEYEGQRSLLAKLIGDGCTEVAGVLQAELLTELQKEGILPPAVWLKIELHDEVMTRAGVRLRLGAGLPLLGETAAGGHGRWDDELRRPVLQNAEPFRERQGVEVLLAEADAQEGITGEEKRQDFLAAAETGCGGHGVQFLPGGAALKGCGNGAVIPLGRGWVAFCTAAFGKGCLNGILNLAGCVSRCVGGGLLQEAGDGGRVLAVVLAEKAGGAVNPPVEAGAYCWGGVEVALKPCGYGFHGNEFGGAVVPSLVGWLVVQWAAS